jgi:Family of unknown function (DUF5675)
MELTLNRTSFDDESTQGELSVDGVFQCYTLELPNVDGKPGSCIPQGRYNVVLAQSPKFMANLDPWVQQYANQMPHLQNIPGRSLIMIHWGNDPKDTEGCILVGQNEAVDEVENSRLAFADLWDKINLPATNGDCWITLVGGAALAQAAP